MIVPLFVGREKSIRALEEVMRADKQILLATQQNPSEDDPTPETIFDFFQARGFVLERLTTCGGGSGCNQFVFRKALDRWTWRKEPYVLEVVDVPPARAKSEHNAIPLPDY
jgi:ATP-dependent Lon protease